MEDLQLNLDTHEHTLIPLIWQDTDNIINALAELSHKYAGKKICIIWDNAQWHRSKKLKALLGKNKPFEHIHLIWLPPYAPDRNPQEHVWKIGKQAVANIATQTFEELKHIFETAISNKRFNYQI